MTFVKFFINLDLDFTTRNSSWSFNWTKMIFIELDPKMKAKATLCGTKEKREIICGIFTS